MVWGNTLTLINRFEKVEKAETTEFAGRTIHDGETLKMEDLSFKFLCREREWLEAEPDLTVRKRRGRGGSESAKDSKALPPPKRKSAEEALTGGAEAKLSAMGSLPQPQSPTPPSCTDEDPATLERPRKIRRCLGCFTSTSGSGMMSAGGNSLPSQVKLEERDPVPKVEEEVGELEVDELKVCARPELTVAPCPFH